MSQQITSNFGVINENPSELLQFSPNINLGAKFGSGVREILWWNFYHIKSNSYRFQNAIFHQNPSTETKNIFDFVSENMWNRMKSTLFFLQLNFDWFHMISGIKLKISPVSVDGFWWKIALWKRYKVHFIW